MTRDEIRDQVVESRRRQGLPDHVTADRFLDELAREVLDGPLQVGADGEPVRLIADPSTPDGRPPVPIRHECVRMNDTPEEAA